MSYRESQPQQPRVGWLYDGNDETPHIGVAFSDSEESGIQLSIPLRDVTETYWQWFHHGTSGSMSGTETSPVQELPSVLQFHDAQGPVVLVGCRVTGLHTDFNVGTGRIGARYAVLGAQNLNYQHVNGMRTVIPHLAAWMGAQITERETQTDAKGLVTGLTVTANPPEPISLDSDGNLSLQGSFSTKTDLKSGTTLISDHMQVMTYGSTAETWETHLQKHRAFVDLLTVAAWQPSGFKALEVVRDDDLHPHPNGQAARWLPVTTYSLPRPESDERIPQFLFTYRDIGTSGLTKWIDLRRQHARTLITFAQIPRMQTTTIESQLIQSSIALEFLGFDLAEPDNLVKGQLKFRKGLEIVHQSLGFNAVRNPEAWMTHATRVYRAIKHPDNTPPESLDLINVLRDNITVLRCWVAIQLGVDPSDLQERLARDRQASARYEEA